MLLKRNLVFLGTLILTFIAVAEGKKRKNDCAEACIRLNILLCIFSPIFWPDPFFLLAIFVVLLIINVSIGLYTEIL